MQDEPGVNMEEIAEMARLDIGMGRSILSDTFYAVKALYEEGLIRSQPRFRKACEGVFSGGYPGHFQKTLVKFWLTSKGRGKANQIIEELERDGKHGSLLGVSRR